MLFEDKTLENIIADMKSETDPDTNTEEGTLIDHSFRGAAAEFERAYIELGAIDDNGYAMTADREHLILRAKERGIEPFAASNAVWKAMFNMDIEPGTRFSAGDLTYVCTEKIGAKAYRLMCEQPGTAGNTKQADLIPVEYVDGFETGELKELLIPARDEEETEAFRARYISMVGAAQTFGGNRAQYKRAMHGIEGVGACKLYRVTEGERRIRIYFLDSSYKTPSETLVADVQETMDPAGKQGDGEGEAPIFHIVDILPCSSETVDIEADVSVDTGYTPEALLPAIQEKIDGYFLQLARGWEDGNGTVVRILKVSQAMAAVEGVVDVQGLSLNGREENLPIGINSVPVRGTVSCRKSF